MATRTVRPSQPQSFARVARRVLRRRLGAVRRAAAAVSAATTSAAAVHRLRVATRRATAAICVFRPLISRRRRRWLRKALRRIRRAAGEARDLDVLLARGAGTPSTARGGDRCRRLAEILIERRPETRRRLRVGLAELPMAAWDREAAATVAAIDSRKTVGTVSGFACRRARRLTRRFLSRVDRRLRSGRGIHRLRIETKKLRYALEVIAECGAPVVTATSDRPLHHLQARLGEYTDHAASAARLGRWLRLDPEGRDRRTLRSARSREATLAKQARRACERWWTPARQARLVRKVERMLGGFPK